MENFTLDHLVGDIEKKIIKMIADDCKDEILSDFKNKRED
jgi:hypothetical protein